MSRGRRPPILVGLPGAGKTTVGKALARLLHTEFVDVDQLIEQNESSSINEIFAAQGEDYFRELESRLVEELVAGPPTVIAPGGGWASRPGNLETVRSRAFTVYLQVHPHTAAARLESTDDRPLLLARDTEETIVRLWRERSSWYEQCEVTVATGDRAPEELAREVQLLAQEKAGW